MTYAALSDITTLYGVDALFVADRDNSGTADEQVVERALVSAAAEIDSHLAVRYEMPIPGIHQVLVQLCVDIALYRMASSADVMTDDHRTRYEDALKTLMRLAEGKAQLILPVDPADDDDIDGVSGSGPKPIVSGGPEREFTRQKMSDF